MALQVEAVHQPQRAELVFGELAGHASLDLVAILLDTFAHDAQVDVVVAVHACPVGRPERAREQAPEELVSKLTNSVNNTRD